MSKFIARTAMLVVLLAVQLSPALAQQCSGHQSRQHCESTCGVVMVERRGMWTTAIDPVCAEGCKNCFAPEPLHPNCPANDTCVSACPLVRDPASQPGLTSMIRDPACTQKCPAC